MRIFSWIRDRLSLRRVEDTPSATVHRIIRQAYGLLQAQEYEQARTLLLQALAFRDDIAEYATLDWLLLGMEAAWLFTNMYEDGIEFYSRYLDRYANDWAAHHGRASMFWYAGHLAEAVAGYSRTLELNPNSVASLSARGQVFAETGQADNAIADFKLALEKIETHPLPNATWGKLYEQMEAYIHNGWGLALGNSGEIASAMDEFARSIAQSPENAWVYYNRARVYELSGEPIKARADFETALAKKEPPLNLSRKNYAEERVRHLSG